MSADTDDVISLDSSSVGEPPVEMKSEPAKKKAKVQKASSSTADGEASVDKSSTKKKSTTSAKSSSSASGGTASKAENGKKKITSQDDANEYILSYLHKVNRPVSAVLLDQNLHGAIPKALLQRTLDLLTESGEVMKKEFNKSVIYWPSQARYNDILPSDIVVLSEKAANLVSLKNEVTMERKQLESRVSSFKAALSDADILAQVEQLRSDHNLKVDRLQKIISSSSSGKAVDPNIKTKLQEKIKKHRKAWIDRKSSVMQVVEAMSEASGKKPLKICEDIGIETDNDSKSQLQDISF